MHINAYNNNNTAVLYNYVLALDRPQPHVHTCMYSDHDQCATEHACSMRSRALDRAGCTGGGICSWREEVCHFLRRK